MAVRIRNNGRVFCAALTKPEIGDCYIDDGLHYELSVKRKILVTTENDYHMENGGEWWWKGQEPVGIEIDSFYKQNDMKDQKKQTWVITVNGYGSFEFKGTEAEAEVMRKHKSNWEGGSATKRIKN